MPLPPIPVPAALVERVLAVRRRALDLVDLSYPAEGLLWDLVAGLQRTKLAGALVDTGIADALGEQSRTPAEVARELDLDPEVTHRVLLAAAGARLAELDRSGRVRLSRIGSPLRRDHPHTIASWVSYVAAPANARGYEQLVDQIREGAEPSGHRRAFGDSIWEHFGTHPEEGARFGKAMRELTAIDVASLILIESVLSYLGLGVAPPTPSWGNMLSTATQDLTRGPWLVWAPGAAIFLTVLCLYLVGDGLRDALDPRLSRSS